MTARPPVETVEGASESPPESPPESLTEGERTHAGLQLDSSEPSMSKTIEAILSKGDADDEGPVASSSGGIGTKTLLGIPLSGLNLPLPQATREPTSPESEAGDEFVSVEDMFTDGEDDDEGPDAKTKVTADDDRMGDLLGEVADALNVQAAESREQVVGALPGPPRFSDRSGGSERQSPADVLAGPTDDELEFEDPDDGPTTLNAGAEGSSSSADEDEEAVVLGPAKLPGSLAIPSFPTGRLPIPAPPGAPGKRATPYPAPSSASLPAFPASGRARLPTPAGVRAMSIPLPAGARSAPPQGTPASGVPEAKAAAESSSRRTIGRVAAEVSDRSSAAVRKTLTLAMESASVTLRRDLRFKVGSFAGALIATFAGGLLLGRVLTGSGKTIAPVAESASVVASPQAKVVKAEPAAPGVRAPSIAPLPEPASGTGVAANAAPDPAAGPRAAAAQPPTEANVARAPAIEGLPPPAPDPGATANAQMAFDPQPIHRRRARRLSPMPKDDTAPATATPKPATRPAAGAPAARPAKAAPASSAKPAGKTAKPAWHDPFAD